MGETNMSTFSFHPVAISVTPNWISLAGAMLQLTQMPELNFPYEHDSRNFSLQVNQERSS